MGYRTYCCYVDNISRKSLAFPKQFPDNPWNVISCGRHQGEGWLFNLFTSGGSMAFPNKSINQIPCSSKTFNPYNAGATFV